MPLLEGPHRADSVLHGDPIHLNAPGGPVNSPTSSGVHGHVLMSHCAKPPDAVEVRHAPSSPTHASAFQPPNGIESAAAASVGPMPTSADVADVLEPSGDPSVIGIELSSGGDDESDGVSPVEVQAGTTTDMTIETTW